MRDSGGGRQVEGQRGTADDRVEVAGLVSEHHVEQLRVGDAGLETGEKSVHGAIEGVSREQSVVRSFVLFFRFLRLGGVFAEDVLQFVHVAGSGLERAENFGHGGHLRRLQILNL